MGALCSVPILPARQGLTGTDRIANRLRKVKCDEARPACARCTSTGRVCDGFDPASDGAAVALSRGSPSPSLTTARVSSSYSDPLEARSLLFFVERTITQFQAFFPDDFWNSHVLQFALSQDCIRHALVSLSAHHERYTNPEASSDTAFALRQHNLAIKSLLACGDPSKSLHVHLVSCLIFICIEALQGELRSAIRLFKHGLSMIQELQRRSGDVTAPSTGTDSIVSAVVALLNRFAVQVALLAGDIDPDLSIGVMAMSSSKPALSPHTKFRTLLEARESILQLAIHALSGASRTPEGFTYASACLQWWSNAFDNMVQEQSEALSKRGITLLELHRRYLAAHLKLPNSTNGDIRWDDHVEEFSNVVSCAEKALELGPDAGALATPQFHMDLGVIPVMFSTVLRCRDPDVRRRALDVLRNHRLQEGIWDSSLTLRVSERIVVLEESSIAAGSRETPQRVESVIVHMDAEQKTATLQYGLVDHMFEEVLNW